jgi:Protein of unknown function (DUF3071)
MVELEPVGLSEDGQRLVLADGAGHEFAVPMDDRLRGLVRGDRVRTGQLESEMESAQKQSALRPRDIQARIRAGERPEAVAEIAQVPVDRIMGYAVPVIAERQHIAERAQRSAVRRKNPEGPGQLLGDAVAERLRSRNVDPETCDWDAWRREDGRWTVCARFHDDGDERAGTFVFDALSRYTVAEDDDARWLVGDRSADADPRPSAGSGRAGRRLAAVSSKDDAMLFDDDEPTTELTAVADLLGDPDAGGDASRAGTAADASPAAHADGRDTAPEAEQQVARAAPDGEPRPGRGREPRPEKRGRRGRGRASVPSWDEIMFGQRQE